MNRLINYSGGLCCFWTADRVVAQYGPQDVTLLFADTNGESPELYARNKFAAQRWGIPITRISREMTVWELFRKEGMIGNSRSPLCSVKLKREILDAWRNEHCDPADTILYIGFDWEEINRLDDLRAELSRWKIEAPMCEWEPRWDKCRIIEEFRKLGGPMSSAYDQGYPHDNCNKRCVRAGITQWVRTLEVAPGLFAEWEREEQDTITDFTRRGINTEWATMLKDRRGGVTKSMTLKTLRERVEAGEPMPKYDWGGCGCGTTN